MSEYLPFILFFIFFVLPILERVLKGGGQAPPPGPRRPPPPGQPRLPEAQAPEPHRPPELARGRAAEAETADAAADMIPDDLWEILTGERRTRPAPAPVPEAGPGAEWVGEDEEDGYLDEVEAFEHARSGLEEREEEARVEAVLTEREHAVHTAERAPVREPPQLKIFDVAGVPSAAQRHAEFHRRIDEAAPARRPARAPTRSTLAGLDAAGLRRAFVLREVLGPPKALE